MSDCATNDELYHYGVVGMKWGVRRGKADKAYAKASKKLKKLNDRVDRQESAAMRRSAKADIYATSRIASSKNKAKARAKAQQSAAKLGRFVHKGKRWYEAMDKAFKDTPISMTAEQKSMYEKFKGMERDRMIGRY